MIEGPDHFTILTDDLGATERFYRDILELIPGDRPDFRFPGLWLYGAGRPILHVVQRDEMPNPRAGVLDHMAFRGRGLNLLLSRLAEKDIDYRLTRLPAPYTAWQVFFHDPNGAKVEVNFEGQERPDDGSAGTNT